MPLLQTFLASQPTPRVLRRSPGREHANAESATSNISVAGKQDKDPTRGRSRATYRRVKDSKRRTKEEIQQQVINAWDLEHNPPVGTESKVVK